MSPKRRAGGRGRSSVVARLAQRRSRNPFTSRNWVSVETGRLHRFARRIRYRQLVAAAFLIALFLGTTTSQSVIRRVQGDASIADAMRVQAIAVMGHERLSASRVAQASGVPRQSLASALDATQITETLESHEMIRSAKVAPLPNGKLVVRVEEREPVALLRAPETPASGFVWRLVDTNGTPFARAEAREWSRLPRLRSRAPLATDEADPRLVRALELATLIHDTEGPNLEPREIELPSPEEGLGWVLHSRTLPRTVILGEGDLKPRLEKLALLLASNMPPARAAEEIDLRFAGQAVLRSGSPSR